MLTRAMPLLRSWLARLAIVPALLLLASCGGGDGDDATPSPTPRTPTPVDTAATPTPAAPETPYRLVYREYGAKEDIIWRVLAADPQQREKLTTIGHREGYGVVASISPDGRMLAYLSLPEDARSEDSSQAEAYVIDLKIANNTKLIASGVDYRFKPLWSPDGQLLFMRRLAGPEILSADVSIIFTKVAHDPLEGEPTPTPTPKPTPVPADQTPAPTPIPEDPIKTIMTAKYSQVLSFVPLGFSEDKRSLYFIQVNGGLQGTTLVGAYAPATVEAILAEATPTPAPEPTPTPDPNAPPTPTPKPNAKLIVTLTDQAGDDFSLSPDMHKVAFRASGLIEGQFVNQAFVSDLVAETVSPIKADGLPPGDHLRPAWHPSSDWVAVGLLPSAAGPGRVAIVSIIGEPPQFLPAPAAGFDVPRAWSPDGTWLAVTHWSGESPANPGEASLELVALTGQRAHVAAGAKYDTENSIVGWFIPS